MICTGFSFPLTYAEKGLLQVKLHGPGWDDLPLQAGQAPQCCSRQGPMLVIVWKSCFPVLDQSGVQYSQTADSVTVLGVSEHSKMQTEGVRMLLSV